ncbi:tetratricopeptide repeat protein [bacterium]|nr:tetratricopeptide repeat protein [bacterium]
MKKKEQKKMTSEDWFEKALMESNSISKRIGYYTKAIELDPVFFEAYTNRGADYAVLDKNKLAVTDLTKAIEINPDEGISYVNRGHVYCNMDEHEKAIIDYITATKINPQNNFVFENIGYSYLQLGKYEMAIKYFDQCIDECDEVNSDNYFFKGKAYYAMDKIESAIENFNSAIKLNKKFSNAYNYRALCFCKEEKFKKALKDHNKAIELNPDDGDLLFNRGVTHCNLNEFKEGIEDYKMAMNKLKDKGTLGLLFWNIGNAYIDNDQTEEAIKYFTKIINDKSFQPLVYFSRAWAYYDTEEYEKGIKDYETGLMIEEDINEYSRLIELYIFTGRYRDAFSIINKTIPSMDEEDLRVQYDYYEFIVRTMLNKNIKEVKEELLNILDTGVELYFPMDHFEMWLDDLDISPNKVDKIIEITQRMQLNMK